METPNKIEDCEIIVDNFRLYHKQCIGPRKYDKYMMLNFTHSHHIKNELGIVDVFLTKNQALDLIKELANMIAVNDTLYND